MRTPTNTAPLLTTPQYFQNTGWRYDAEQATRTAAGRDGDRRAGWLKSLAPRNRARMASVPFMLPNTPAQFQRRAGEGMALFMERASARWAGMPVFVTTPAGVLCECCAPFTGYDFDTTEASLQAGPGGCYNCGAGK